MPCPPDLDGDHRWRPFQIAFILLCLEGIANPHSDDRELTDLLWFPTGGGKTEAYLGLLAFTALLRRLRDPRPRPRGNGDHAIHAAAADHPTIRARLTADLLPGVDPPRRLAGWATTPIEIGLWVGRGATPNTLAEAKVSIDKLRQGSRSRSRTRSSCIAVPGALGPSGRITSGSPNPRSGL